MFRTEILTPLIFSENNHGDERCHREHRILDQRPSGGYIFLKPTKAMAIRAFFLLLMACSLTAAIKAGDTESTRGSIRFRGGQFYLDIGKGPGVSDAVVAVGQRDLLEGAAKKTNEIFSQDAAAGLVGRFDALLVEVKD